MSLKLIININKNLNLAKRFRLICVSAAAQGPPRVILEPSRVIPAAQKCEAHMAHFRLKFTWNTVCQLLVTIQVHCAAGTVEVAEGHPLAGGASRT